MKEKTRKSVLSLAMDEELDAKLTETSKKYGMSKNACVRMMVNTYYDQQEAIKAMQGGNTLIEQLGKLQAELQKASEQAKKEG